MDEMLTVEEVAEMLKVKPLTVRQMFRERRLRAFKIGKAWRTTRTWLEEDLRAMTVPPLPQTELHAEKPDNRSGIGRRSPAPRRPREETSASDATGTGSETAPPTTGRPVPEMVLDMPTAPPEAILEPVRPAHIPDDNPQSVPPMPDNSSAAEEEPVRQEDPQQYLF